MHHTAYLQVRRLMAGLFLAGLVGLVFGPLSQAVPVRAAAQIALSGRVYNLSTGTGYSGVALNLCAAGNAVTGANGNWQATVDSGTYYCVRLAGGTPNAPSGPMLRNNPEVGAATSYENQQAGVNCYHNASCSTSMQTWDRPVDGGLDFAYSNEAPVATAAPAATPAPTPAPAPAAASALGTPTDFAAKASGDNDHTISLSWTAVGDPAVAKTYKLERSLDRNTWEALADNLTEVSYQDSKALPGVHYYYRLSAVNAAGAASDYALADLAMGDVLAATSQPDGVYTSSDGLARATVHAGTMPEGATCTVNTVSRPSAVDGRTIKAGPYQLVCKDSMSAAVTQFSHPVSWRIKLTGLLQGYQAPQAMQQATVGGKAESLVGGSYDAKAGFLTVDAPGAVIVSVAAAPLDYGWVGYVVAGGLVAILLTLLAFIPFRSRRKMSYQEYLRAKYYNL